MQYLVEESDSLLVVGSSLQVHPGYRIVHQASKIGSSIAFMSIGMTRADPLADVKTCGKASEVLEKVL